MTTVCIAILPDAQLCTCTHTSCCAQLFAQSVSLCAASSAYMQKATRNTNRCRVICADTVVCDSDVAGSYEHFEVVDLGTNQTALKGQGWEVRNVAR